MEHRLLCRTHCYTILYNTIQYNTISTILLLFFLLFLLSYALLSCPTPLYYTHSLAHSFYTVHFNFVLSYHVLFCSAHSLLWQ